MRDDPFGTLAHSPDESPNVPTEPDAALWQNPAGDRIGTQGDGVGDWAPMEGEPGFESPPGQIPEVSKEPEPDPALADVQPGTSDGPGPGKPEEKAPETPSKEEEPTKAAETEEDKPAEAEESTEADEDADILGILDKYKTKTALGKAYKHLQQFASGKEEEKKKAEAALNKQADLIDRHFEEDGSGNLVLRTEAAAARLNEVRGEQPQPFALPDRKALWIEEVSKLRREYAEVLGTEDPEEIKAAIARSGERINQAVESRYQQAVEQQQAEHRRNVSRAGQLVRKHLDAHPEHKDVMKSVNDWYERFPAPLRASLLLNGWLPVDAIATAEYAKANLESAVREAFAKGKEIGAKSREAPAGAPSSPGSRVPQSPDQPGDAEAEFKSRIVNADRLVPLESIFGE